jgi:hypothetical protein
MDGVPMSFTSDNPSKIPKEKPETRRRLGKAGFWLAGSALIGSAALVLWNRRALKAMHEAAENPIEPSRLRDDDGIY